MKKAWQKPKLIVLVRSKTPESVLQLCKTGGVTGADSYDGGCYTDVTAYGATCGGRGDLGIGNANSCYDCNTMDLS